MLTAHDLDKRYPYAHQIWQNLSDKTRESVVKCLSHLDDPLDFLDRNEREKGRFMKEAAAVAQRLLNIA